VFRDKGATYAALTAHLRGADVLHLATHGLAHAGSAASPALVLAGEQANLLTADAIQRLPIDRLRVAVLGACATARGPASASEGVLSIARAFHLAGAQVVVANLWPIEDASAVELYERFYRALAAGQPPTTAMRRAQLALLSQNAVSGVADAVWAAPLILGGIPTTALTPTRQAGRDVPLTSPRPTGDMRGAE